MTEPAPDPTDPPSPNRRRDVLFRPALYPSTYAWYVFVNALDVMFTWIVLHFGGDEANAIARYVLYRWDLPGLVLFKFTLVTVVVLICEYVGRRERRTGLLLARWGVAITCVPVAAAIVQLLAHPLQ